MTSGSIHCVLISKHLRITLALATAVAALSACTSNSPATPEQSPSLVPSAPAESGSASAAPSSVAPSPSVEPATDLSAITVSDEDKPVIEFSAPWAIASTTTKVLRPSDNPQKLTQDSVVTVNYVGVNGTTGQVFDSSYESGSPATLSLANVVPGFRLGLDKQAVGSRVLIGMPASDGYPTGNPSGTIKPGDSLLFVVDIISANFEEAMGQTQPPVEGMPAVTDSAQGPTVTIDMAKQPPADLQVATLIKGSGAAVAETSQLQVKYRSWVWATGASFEDSWAPQSGRLDGLIEGWRKGLVGQTAGSRVMLVVPPALAYPEGRSTSPALQPGQTLVYVIDILDVQ